MISTIRNHPQHLYKLVQDELHRIVVNGQGPPIITLDPDPDGPHLREVELAVNLGEDEETGAQHVVRLGSFWLVPELLERLKAIHGLTLFGRVAPLLYAIREFSMDEEWIDESKDTDDA